MGSAQHGVLPARIFDLSGRYDDPLLDYIQFICGIPVLGAVIYSYEATSRASLI